jgi:tetratricopeptide (TPR) repeat protein
MFTINIYLKFALIGLCLIGGIILAIFQGFWYSFPFILIGILLILSYIFLGTVQSSAEMIQTGNFDGAEKRINLTYFPKLMYVTNRAFYFIIRGSLAMNKGDNNEAEELFNNALNLKLPSDNEKGLILLQLANINGTKGKWTAAKNHFREAKKLKITETQLKQQMSQFEKALSNRGQMKAAGAGNKGAAMMRGGGKRRRPKMR